VTKQYSSGVQRDLCQAQSIKIAQCLNQ